MPATRFCAYLLDFLDFRRLAEWYRAIVRVRGDFRDYHHAPPKLLRPQTFSEKVQWRKLFDLNPQFAVLSDKLRVRDFIAERVGPGLLAPLLWVGEDPDAVPFETFKPPFVVKSTHAAGQSIVVSDIAAFDVVQARARMKAWLGLCYAAHVEEPAYALVPRRVMVERCLLDQSGNRPVEPLHFVFEGRVHYIYASFFKGSERCNGGFYDRLWRPLDWFMRKPRVHTIERPKRLDEMVQVAERLAAGIDHLRVDFYDCGDRFYVGELTLYSWSGNKPFHQREMDLALGKPWRIRRAALRALRTVMVRRRRIDPNNAR